MDKGENFAKIELLRGVRL